MFKRQRKRTKEGEDRVKTGWAFSFSKSSCFGWHVPSCPTPPLPKPPGTQGHVAHTCSGVREPHQDTPHAPIRQAGRRAGSGCFNALWVGGGGLTGSASYLTFKSKLTGADQSPPSVVLSLDSQPWVAFKRCHQLPPRTRACTRTRTHTLQAGCFRTHFL